jgi:dihydrofolate reductase
MGKLTYSMNVSLDGFVDTTDHGLDWIRMDDELHAWFNDQEGAAEAFLHGRRMFVLGAGTPFFPPLPHPLDLELVETRTFDSGAVYLGYGRR